MNKVRLVNSLQPPPFNLPPCKGSHGWKTLGAGPQQAASSEMQSLASPRVPPLMYSGGLWRVMATSKLSQPLDCAQKLESGVQQYEDIYIYYIYLLSPSPRTSVVSPCPSPPPPQQPLSPGRLFVKGSVQAVDRRQGKRGHDTPDSARRKTPTPPLKQPGAQTFRLAK